MSQTIQEVTENLRKIFDDQVNRLGTLTIEDFIEKNFIPGLKSIQGSPSISEDHVKQISAMVYGISTERDLYLVLNGLKVKQTEDAIKLLKLHIEEHLDSIDKILNKITLSLGKNVTSMVSLAEEVSPSDVTVIGGEDYPLGPGGNYYIKRASDRWLTRSTTGVDVIGDIFGGSRDKSGLETIFEGIPSSDILAITSKNANSISPVIGKSLINGRRLLSAIQTSQPVSLLIVPIEKYQAPHFLKVPLRQHFLSYINTEKDTSMMIVHTLREGVNKSGKPYIVAELSKILENVFVLGREEKKVTIHEKVFGFEGVLKDFLMIMIFQNIEGREETELERDLRELTELVDSFHPVTFLDPSEKIREMEEAANKGFHDITIENGYSIFMSQFALFIAQIMGLIPEDSADRLVIMQLLKPFQALGNELKIQENKQWKEQMGEDAWQDIWDTFDRAERGDAMDFIDLINEMKESL